MGPAQHSAINAITTLAALIPATAPFEIPAIMGLLEGASLGLALGADDTDGVKDG